MICCQKIRRRVDVLVRNRLYKNITAQTILFVTSSHSIHCLDTDGRLIFRTKSLDVYHRKKISRAYIRGSGKTAVIWSCECRCGNIVDVDAQALRSGHTVSCGCYEKDHPGRFVDLSERRFGLLVAKKCVRHGGKNGYSLWRCKCDCGNEKDVLSVNLVHGVTCSCGCQAMSNMEIQVVNYFKSIGLSAGFDYVGQQKFQDLRSDKGRCLSYDFALYYAGSVVGLVECQGKQHYEAVDFFLVALKNLMCSCDMML